MFVSCKKDKDDAPNTPSPFSIVSSDFANAGDTIIMYIDETNIALLSLVPGQNITWDYSILSPDSEYTVIFHNPSNTPGAQYFSSISNMAVQPEPDQPFYLYLNKTTDKIEGVGVWADVQGNEIHPSYTDKPIFFKFPITYNSILKDSSFLVDIISMGQGMYGKLEMIQKFDITYDGIGTIKLPNNKTYQCIREKKEEIFITLVYVSISPNGPWGNPIQSTYDTTYSYNYFTKNKKWNVASVFVENFANNEITSVEYIKEQ